MLWAAWEVPVWALEEQPASRLADIAAAMVSERTFVAFFMEYPSFPCYAKAKRRTAPPFWGGPHAFVPGVTKKEPHCRRQVTPLSRSLLWLIVGL